MSFQRLPGRVAQVGKVFGSKRITRQHVEGLKLRIWLVGNRLERRLRHILKTALVVGISVAAAQRYWELHQDLNRKPFYRRRLDEVLQIGERHWQAADGKKSPLLMLAPQARGQRA